MKEIKLKKYFCFVCYERNKFTKTSYFKNIFDKNFFINKCSKCSAEFTNKIPMNDYTWGVYYDSSGADKINDIKHFIKKYLHLFFHKLRIFQLKKIEKMIFSNISKKKNLKMLDYGCGDGYLGNFFIKKNIDVYSCDINKKKTYTLNKKIKYFQSRSILKQKVKFDVIILRHVLEHCPDPKKLINLLKKKLNKNGIIYIEVPNHDLDTNFYLKIFKSNYLQLGLPHHINHFNVNSLSKILSNGYKKKIYYLELPVLGQSLVNTFFKESKITFGLINIILYPIQRIFSLIIDTKVAICFILKKS